MGRKSRFDRRNKGSLYPPQNWNPPPKRGRSRTRSPTPDRTRNESPYPRRQHRPTEVVSRTRSPSREREYLHSRYEEQPLSFYGRERSRSPSPRRQRDNTKLSLEERIGGQYVSPDRTQKLQSTRSRSPSPSHDRNKSKKWKSNKKPRFDKKQRNRDNREKDPEKKSSHRPHDIWKPVHNGDGSPPSSRGRPMSSLASSSPPPHAGRSVSPSARDRVTTSGGSREFYKNRPTSSYGHDRQGSWTQASQPIPPRSPTYRYPTGPADDRNVYPKYSQAEYDRPVSSNVRQPSPVHHPYNEYQNYPKQDYDRRDYEEYRGVPTRPRGQDYNKEEREATHSSRERYPARPAESRYQSNYPERSRNTYEFYEKYPIPPEPRYAETRGRGYPEEVPRRRTPEGPRAHYEEKYYQRHPHEPPRRDPYEQAHYPPPRDYPPPPEEYTREDYARRSPPPSYPSQYDTSGYREESRERYPELTHILHAPPSQEDFPPRPEVSLPPPPPPQLDPYPPPISTTSTSAPKPNGGIKPFTLKGNVLKKLKRTHDHDHEPSDRVFKSSRRSPRQLAPTAAMPPPTEIQQTQTPETPSNRDREPERRVSTKEKGASMFERIGQVGEGTYGKVYKARNTLTGELVALKKIRMESEREGFPITATREIKLLESLRHPNIIHLQEMMFEKTFVYMVFEYMDHDLAGILTHPHFTFPPSQIKELLRQMLEGLHYLHHRGILHRDIKGSNILLSSSGQLKLADFGLARHYHKRRPNLDYSNRVITLWYRPPELLLGATAYGPAVDIWSVGCIMLEMVTKKALFPGIDEIDQLVRIWGVMGSPTAEKWPKVTELPWWELVKPQVAKPEVFHEDVLSEQGLDLASRLLALDPEQRPTALEALQHPYFTTELPRPERPTGYLSITSFADDSLVTMDGEWHEFESKQRKRQQRANEERKRASSIDTPLKPHPSAAV